MVESNSSFFSQTELLCFSMFAIFGVFAVFTVRYPKQVLAIFITFPISAFCGSSAYFMGRWMYNPHSGVLYGLLSFAFSGLIIISILKWVTNLEAT